MNELDASCSTWKPATKLPLLSMTMNERQLYKKIYPNGDFSSSSNLILCSIIDQLLELIHVFKNTKQLSTRNPEVNICARFTIDSKHGSIQEIDILNSEATTQ